MDTKKQISVGGLPKEKCFGCTACVFSCPADAISMVTNWEGFYEPAIDFDKCIGCKKCKLVCQAYYPPKKESIKQLKVATSKNPDLYYSSTSGGAFSTIARYFIVKKNASVFASAMPKERSKKRDMRTQVIEIVDSSDIKKLQGSKYLQSDLNDSYKKVNERLKEGKQVLFCGTPCQVGGLYKFLGKGKTEQPRIDKLSENLTTLDLVCHGTPSQKLFLEHLENRWPSSKGKISNFRFRYKLSTKAGEQEGLAFCFNFKRKKYFIPHQIDAYYRTFLSGVTFRERCYSCIYASPERVGDLTLGDSQVRRADKNFQGDKMVSVVGINTKRGEEVWKEVSSLFTERDMTEREKNEEFKKNVQLRKPFTRPKERDYVYKLANETSLTDAMRKLKLQATTLQRFKLFLNRQILAHLPYGMKSCLKSIYVRIKKTIRRKT
jgi:coenzyme F420-reducing hydrogenase beta subunit